MCSGVFSHFGIANRHSTSRHGIKTTQWIKDISYHLPSKIENTIETRFSLFVYLREPGNIDVKSAINIFLFLLLGISQRDAHTQNEA